MTLEEIGDAAYIALKTFRKTGEGVSTAVWVTVADGTLFVATARRSGKVKRIANDSRVAVCVADMRGRPKGEWVEAQARIIAGPEGTTRRCGGCGPSTASSTACSACSAEVASTP